MTTERFFGGRDQRIENLRRTLRWIANNHPTEPDLTTWLRGETSADSAETISRNIDFLETIDLLNHDGETYTPTNKGDTFWRHDEPLVMYEGLARGVDGFREILRIIADDNRTLNEIQGKLRPQFPEYELPKEVIADHLDWLLSLDLITENDGEYSIPIEHGLFDVGETYSRWFIHDVLKGERYKGIATPSDHPLIFCFTGDSGETYGYEDEFLADDTFLYTGEGTEGDMTMDDGNKAIRDHGQNGESIHLFENSDLPWIVTYLGEYECVDVIETELEDENRNMRDAFRFKLAPIGGTDIEIEVGSPNSLSDTELLEKAQQSTPSEHTGGGSGGSSAGGGRSYPRSEYVREFALRMADGICQGCKEPAPFQNKQGEPYLEVHHITRRSDGGADAPKNVIALCPNCHRRVHEGQDGAVFNAKLKEKARERQTNLDTNNEVEKR